MKKKKMKMTKIERRNIAFMSNDYSNYYSNNHCHDNNTKINICFRLTLTIYLVISSASIQGIICDVICQKDTNFMLPCKCQNGTTGLLIKCTQSSLASLARPLTLINEPIEQLELDSCSISRLFGPIFNDSSKYPALHGNTSLRELSIRSSGLKSIQADSLSSSIVDSVQYLQLDRNLLQNVPTEMLLRFANLKMLNLSSNHIQAIEVSHFPKSSFAANLTELDLSWNKINKLAKNALATLSSLESLNLAGNELAKLEKNILNFGRKLKHLDLSNNKLAALDRQDFNELTALESLALANNLLATIPRSIFSRNGKLYSLDMSYNLLEDIDTYLFKSVRFLKDLNVSGNRIKELGKNIFSPTTRIKRINMSHNQLQALGPETFKNLEYLERIDLSHNQIVNISNDAFNHIFQVEIDLAHNKLTRIFYWAFRDVANMTKLNLSHNLLSDGISLIGFEQTDCTELDLSYNLIEDLSKVPISNFTGIRYLDLSHNQITEFNKKSFSQKVPLYELSVVDASYNNISQVTGNVLERLRSIRQLNLTHNSLRRLTSGAFGNSPTLLELDLSHNNLVEVVAGTLVGLVSLKTLDLTHNRLKKMIPVPVALNYIHLEHNEISQLSKSAFPSLNSLLELHLDHNKLSQIEDSTFGTLLALNTLSLRYNNLSGIPAGALRDLTSLQNLYLDGNQIRSLSRRSFGPTGLPIVFDLGLAHNNISHLAEGSFEGLLQLLKLDLSHNQLQELHPEVFKGLVSLRKLDLSNNRLNRIENKTKSAMDDLLSLEVANFSSNKLSMITGKTFIASAYIPQRLTHLDLSNNLIGIIVNNFADGMRRIEWLSLRNNIINEIYPNVLGNLTRLRHFDLSHNKLRTLKDGALAGVFSNLTELSLASNKLVALDQATLKELDRMLALESLDLSRNRLEELPSEFVRWSKKGIVIDFRHNPIECPCQLLPFVAWIDSIMARNKSLTSITDDLGRELAYRSLKSDRMGSVGATPSTSGWLKLIQQYLSIGRTLANTSCARPESMHNKPVTQMLDLASHSWPGEGSPTSQAPIGNNGQSLTCEPSLFSQSHSYRRLQAPVQFNRVLAYQHDDTGNQMLRIGWFLADQRIDLVNFVIIRARFRDAIDLTRLRLNHHRQLSSQTYGPLEIAIDRVGYDQRDYTYTNLNSDGHHLVCLSYELGDASSEIDLMLQNLSYGISKLATNGSSESATNTLDNMIADQTRFNCIDLAQLLHHDSDTSERLILTGSSSQLSPNWIMLQITSLIWVHLYVIKFQSYIMNLCNY